MKKLLLALLLICNYANGQWAEMTIDECYTLYIKPPVINSVEVTSYDSAWFAEEFPQYKVGINRCIGVGTRINCLGPDDCEADTSRYDYFPGHGHSHIYDLIQMYAYDLQGNELSGGLKQGFSFTDRSWINDQDSCLAQLWAPYGGYVNPYKAPNPNFNSTHPGMTAGYLDSYSPNTLGNAVPIGVTDPATGVYTGFTTGYIRLRVVCDFPVDQGPNEFPDILDFWCYIEPNDNILVDVLPPLPAPAVGPAQVTVDYDFKHPNIDPVISWDAVPDAATYDVQAIVKKGSNKILLSKFSVTTTTTTDPISTKLYDLATNPATAGMYSWLLGNGAIQVKYQVRGVNPAGKGPWTQSQKFNL